MDSLRTLEIYSINGPNPNHFRADVTGFPNLTALSVSYSMSMRHQPITVIGSAKIEYFSSLYLPPNEQLRNQLKIWQVGNESLGKTWLYDVNEMSSLQEIRFDTCMSDANDLQF